MSLFLRSVAQSSDFHKGIDEINRLYHEMKYAERPIDPALLRTRIKQLLKELKSAQ